MNPDLLVIIRHSCSTDLSRLMVCLEQVAKTDISSEIRVVGSLSSDFHTRLQKFFSSSRLAECECRHVSGGEFLPAVNQIVESSHAEFLLLLESGVFLQPGAIPAMIGDLRDFSGVAGVNPVFFDSCGPEATIFHLGTVADSEKCLHYLYEGIPGNSKLAKKKRFFQLAQKSAILLRRSDFIHAGGFNCQLEDLAFYDFCLRVRGEKLRKFVSEPTAHAILNDEFMSWRDCGLWNSLVQRGKICPELLAADYHEHVLADGLEYGMTPWLHEGPANLELQLAGAHKKWLEWRYSPEPATLLAWIKTLPDGKFSEAISLCRDIPATLPRQLKFYEALAHKIGIFARKNHLGLLERQVESWHYNYRRFHLGKLMPGMRALHAAGIYNCSLDQVPAVYDAWIELAERNNFRRLELGAEWPQISIVMPVYNPRHKFFTQAIDSVRAQTYGNWQLCIADDSSTDRTLPALLRSSAEKDDRINIVFREKNGHISRATNSALEMANGPWTAFMDQDDMLASSALAEVAHLAATKKQLKFIYSDEDRIDESNIRRTPNFKPGYDRILLYAGHLSVFKTTLLRSMGGLRPGYEGSQDFDLLLRANEVLDVSEVGHIAKILYHWRVHPESTAGSVSSKPYVFEATRMALEDSAARQGRIGVACSTGKNNFYRLRYAIPEDFSFSVILLDDSGEVSDSLADYLASLPGDFEICWQPLKEGLKIPHNLAANSKINLCALPFGGNGWIYGLKSAMAKASHEMLLVLYAGLSPRADCYVEQMLLMAAPENVGLVGSVIWRDNRIWNGGLYPDITGLPFPLLRGTPDFLLRVFCWGQFLMPRHVLGCSWLCMAIRKAVLRDIHFPEPAMGQFADADFGLRLGEKGLEICATPWGQWNLDRFPQESGHMEGERRFIEKWQYKVRNDGLRNPNLHAASDFNWALNLE